MLRAVAEKFIRVRKSAKIKKDPERVRLRVQPGGEDKWT